MIRRGRPSPLLFGASLLAYAIGIYFRYEYILLLHHPRNNVVGDARNLVGEAWKLLEQPEKQHIAATIWPPGASSMLSLALGLDPTLYLAGYAYFLLSCLTPIFIAGTALFAGGKRAACWALLFTSLHFGFIHYGGFYLSEQPFQSAIALAVWTTVVALRMGEANHDETPRGRLNQFSMGMPVGLAWAVATYFRPNGLPVALAAGAALGLHALLMRDRSRLFALAGGAVGLLVALAPLAQRCTTLRGEFCPVSTNFMMNVALGQAGEVSGLNFVSHSHPNWSSTWFPPGLSQHAYKDTATVPASIYDAGGILSWVIDQVRENPGHAALRVVGNVLDLFRFEYWPDGFDPLSERLVTVNKQLAFVFIVVPGVVAWWIMLRRIVMKRERAPVAIFLVSAFAAVLLIAGISMGEPRYRLPFDGILTVLATSLFLGDRPRFSAAVSRRAFTWAGFSLVATSLVAGLTCLAVVLISHPAIGLGTALFHDARLPRVGVDRRPASRFSTPREKGAAWDDPANFIFKCKPLCKELRLNLDGEITARNIELSLDRNDRYRVVFYDKGAALDYIDFGPGDDVGLWIYRTSIPPGVGKIDTVGILPIYGDGDYSFGHMTLE